MGPCNGDSTSNATRETLQNMAKVQLYLENHQNRWIPQDLCKISRRELVPKQQNHCFLCDFSGTTHELGCAPERVNHTFCNGFAVLGPGSAIWFCTSPGEFTDFDRFGHGGAEVPLTKHCKSWDPTYGLSIGPVVKLQINGCSPRRLGRVHAQPKGVSLLDF